MDLFPTPPLFDRLTPPLGNLLEFLDETYPAKTRGMGLPYGENFTILTSKNSRFSTILPYDRRPDGRAIAYSALSIILCCRTLKQLNLLG